MSIPPQQLRALARTGVSVAVVRRLQKELGAVRPRPWERGQAAEIAAREAARRRWVVLG